MKPWCVWRGASLFDAEVLALTLECPFETEDRDFFGNFM